MASTRLGVVLGGGAFSVEALERAWGSEVADELRASRAALEAKVLTLVDRSW